MAATRRIVMFNRVSADGYFAAPDGNLDWVVQEPEIDREAATNLPESDTILLGRRTYEMFEAFWPKAIDDSPTAPNPHAAGQRSEAIRDVGVWINEANKVVLSRTRKQVTWKNSRLLPEFDPREIEAMKQQPGKDIMVFGSGSIVSQLTEHGLIDEYQFVVGPILLGKGRNLLGDVSKNVRLELLEARTYGSGNIKVRYARAT